MNEKIEDKEELEDLVVYLLSGAIDTENVSDAIKYILTASLTKKHDHLTLIINSYGGSVSDGFALIDVMTGSKVPIYTVGLGEIVSMGLLIFISGTRGHRVLTPNTYIMSHQ